MLSIQHSLHSPRLEFLGKDGLTCPHPYDALDILSILCNSMVNFKILLGDFADMIPNEYIRL